jgi:hypothetical protein
MNAHHHLFIQTLQSSHVFHVPEYFPTTSYYVFQWPDLTLHNEFCNNYIIIVFTHLQTLYSTKNLKSTHFVSIYSFFKHL